MIGLKVKRLRVVNGTPSHSCYGVLLANGITQCYLPPDTSEYTSPQSQPDRPVLDLLTREGWEAELAQVSDYIWIGLWFTRPQAVSHPSSNTAVHGRGSNSQPVDHASVALTTTPPSHLEWATLNWNVGSPYIHDLLFLPISTIESRVS